MWSPASVRPRPIDELERDMPEVYEEFTRIVRHSKPLPRHAGHGVHHRARASLDALQTRTGKRSGAAAIKLAVSMVNEGVSISVRP